LGDLPDDELADGDARAAAGTPPIVTLRAAIEQGNHNGGNITINFAPGLSGGCITLFSRLPALTANFNIVGLGANVIDVERDVDAPTSFRVFDISATASVVISGLSIRYGQDDRGGGIRNTGNLVLVDVTVVDNHADEIGGGIYNGPAGRLSMLGCRVGH